MSDNLQRTLAPHPLERSLVMVGALGCLVITIIVWDSVSANQPMWPLPALYLIEVVALSGLAVIAFLRGGRAGSFTLWAVVGILLAFSILGALSVGSLYFPTTLLFAVPAISYDLRNKQSIGAHLGTCILAAIAQAALMLAVIGLLRG